ncbi:unnamed protein product [Pedinophyceae sp. YPF-701]|nr:unnamed protein product [Pedinophyceae sp. YPF-701]
MSDATNGQSSGETPKLDGSAGERNARGSLELDRERTDAAPSPRVNIYNGLATPPGSSAASDYTEDDSFSREVPPEADVMAKRNLSRQLSSLVPGRKPSAIGPLTSMVSRQSMMRPQVTRGPSKLARMTSAAHQPSRRDAGARSSLDDPLLAHRANKAGDYAREYRKMLAAKGPSMRNLARQSVAGARVSVAGGNRNSVDSGADIYDVEMMEKNYEEHGGLSEGTRNFMLKAFGEPTNYGARFQHVALRGAGESKFVIHPMSAGRRYWDVLIMLITVFNVIVVPARLALFWAREDDRSLNAWSVVDICMDLMFLFDIALNFNTGIIYESDQVVVMDRRVIATSYVRSWFFLDLVSSVPLDLILVGEGGGAGRLNKIPKVFKILRLSKLLRLMRVTKILRYLQRFDIFAGMSSFMTRVIKLMAGVLIFAHWNACMQFLLAAVNDFPYNSWVVREGLEFSSPMRQYSTALFQAFSHMLCIGYGPNPPEPHYEVWVVIISMVCGAVLFVILVGIITSVLVQADYVDGLYRNQQAVLSQYMSMRSIPGELRNRILENHEFRWRTGKFMQEKEMLALIPACLRTEVALHNSRDLLDSVPFLQEADEGFLASLVVRFEPEVYVPGDMIIRQGEIANEMYFIKSGRVQVESEGHPITVLSDGSYFGEIGILRKAIRTADVRALTPVEVFTLKREDFYEILERFPDSDRALRVIADHRQKMFKKYKGRDPGAAARGRPEPAEQAGGMMVPPAIQEGVEAAAGDSGPHQEKEKVRRTSKQLAKVETEQKQRKQGAEWGTLVLSQLQEMEKLFATPENVAASDVAQRPSDSDVPSLGHGLSRHSMLVGNDSMVGESGINSAQLHVIISELKRKVVELSKWEKRIVDREHTL